jgi:hypothetical protein
MTAPSTRMNVLSWGESRRGGRGRTRRRDDGRWAATGDRRPATMWRMRRGPTRLGLAWRRTQSHGLRSPVLRRRTPWGCEGIVITELIIIHHLVNELNEFNESIHSLSYSWLWLIERINYWTGISHCATSPPPNQFPFPVFPVFRASSCSWPSCIDSVLERGEYRP